MVFIVNKILIKVPTISRITFLLSIILFTFGFLSIFTDFNRLLGFVTVVVGIVLSLFGLERLNMSQVEFLRLRQLGVLVVLVLGIETLIEGAMLDKDYKFVLGSLFILGAIIMSFLIKRSLSDKRVDINVN